jgi:hypothetical protein
LRGRSCGCFTAARPAPPIRASANQRFRPKSEGRAHDVPIFEHDIAAGEGLETISAAFPVKPVAAQKERKPFRRDDASINLVFGRAAGCYELASLLRLAWIVVDDSRVSHWCRDRHRCLRRMSASTDPLPPAITSSISLSVRLPRRLPNAKDR